MYLLEDEYNKTRLKMKNYKISLILLHNIKLLSNQISNYNIISLILLYLISYLKYY